MSLDNPDLFAAIQELLSDFFHAWRDELAPSALSKLQIFRQSSTSTSGQDTTIIRTTIQALLLKLAAYHWQQAEVLRLRFIEDKSVKETAKLLDMSEPAVHKAQAGGLQWMATRIYEKESEHRLLHRHQMLLRMEATTRIPLVGVDEHLVKLLEWLATSEPSHPILIEGIGGIGKTALAQVVIHHLIGLPMFVGFAWITARDMHLDLGGTIRFRPQATLTAETLIDQLVAQLSNQDSSLTSFSHEKKQNWLYHRLKQEPHLIVIDNLETVEPLEQLLPLMHQLSHPSRFLLTSRMGLPGEADIRTFRVPGLSANSALQLLRQEATVRNLPEVVHASDDELRPIYETVGGNPLALRLVVGQLISDEIKHVLKDLQQVRGMAAENLYTYIYRRAYEKLDPSTRKVWLALPLVVESLATIELLTRISRQNEQHVRNALRTLTQMNLVDCRGTPNKRTYSIHSLTRTFLQEQVVKWDAKGV